MKKILSIFFIASLIAVTGCTSHPIIPEKPIGKGFLNLCVSDPIRAGYWQKTDDVLWNTPETRSDDRSPVAGFPACDNVSVTIWAYQQGSDGSWYRVTTRTKDGRSDSGWLAADHLRQISNETRTEWSDNYSAIVGLWDRAGQGNGAKIWYEFTADGKFTFNYAMSDNRDSLQDKGSWAYLGNYTYDLISNVSADHQHTNITLNKEERLFRSGIVYSSKVNVTSGNESSGSETERWFDPAGGQEIVYAKE